MTQHTASKSGQHTTVPGVPYADGPTAPDTVREVTNQVKDSAGQMASQAREQVAARLAGQKDRAAEGLSSVAHVLRQSGQQLREQDQPNITAYFDQAATQVDRFSSYLQQRDLGQLLDDGERFARHQPALFLGGAFVLGLLGARFLKSSRPYPEPTNGYAAGAALADYRRGYAEDRLPSSVAMPSYDDMRRPGSYTATSEPSAFGQRSARGGAPYDRRREE